MEPPELRRAVAAALSTVLAAGLTVADAIVLSNSNKLTVRLMPCDVAARIAPAAHQVAQFEIDVALRLAEAQSPVAALDPRMEPRGYERDDFIITFWRYYEARRDRAASPAEYASALERLHAGLRTVRISSPHFTDRVAEALWLAESSERTPGLPGADREFLIGALRNRSQAISECGAAEQLLHGEPHPGNVISTPAGPVFIDLETCCRGPAEFDLAHVPEAVSDSYPNASKELLDHCRALVLAMVAAWRWDTADQFPDRQRAAHRLLAALRNGPPWPTLDAVMRPPGTKNPAGD